MKKLVLALFFIHGIAICQDGDTVQKQIRLSLRVGYLMGFLSSERLPLAINYERLLGKNFSLGGSAGFLLIPKHDGDQYYLAQLSLRKYFFGDYKRLVVGAHPFFSYNHLTGEETRTGLTIQLGYLWQWSRVFLSFEGGLGPGFEKRGNAGFAFQKDIVEATLNLGTAF